MLVNVLFIFPIPVHGSLVLCLWVCTQRSYLHTPINNPFGEQLGQSSVAWPAFSFVSHYLNCWARSRSPLGQGRGGWSLRLTPRKKLGGTKYRMVKDILPGRRSTELDMLNEQVWYQAAREEAAGPGFSTATICFLFGPRMMELVMSHNNEKVFQSKSPSPSAEQGPLSEQGKPGQLPVSVPPLIPFRPRCLLYF